jgi:glycosyltransferase involved in cell wall biosynthesis
VEGELPSREALRRSLTLDGNAFWLGYFGQLDPTRGVEDLFEAVATLRTHHDVRLVMIGSAGRPERYEAEAASGAYLTAMLELPHRLGIADAVRWTDYLADADVVGYLRGIDVCVLPYRRNHIGRSALAAALEAGAPTVLAGSAASVAPLVPGRDVALVPPRSPDVLARTIENILRDEHLRDQLVAGAVGGARNFSWPLIGERAESIYRRAARA